MKFGSQAWVSYRRSAVDAKLFIKPVAGKSGIRPIDRFDTSKFETKLAALVDGFNARKLAPTLDVRRADLLTRYAMVAAGLAFQDSKLDLRTADADRLGLVMA